MSLAGDRAVDLLGPLGKPALAAALVRAMLAGTEEPWAIGEDPGLVSYLAPDVAPTDWFPWLANVAGASFDLKFTEAQQRAELANPASRRRGTRARLIEAVQETLTGTKFVFVDENNPAPRDVPVVTLASETSDSDVTKAAALSQKPAGVRLTYQTIDRQLYVQLADAYATYGDVAAAYDSYGAVALDETSA